MTFRSGISAVLCVASLALLGACSDEELIPREQAVDAVLDRLGTEERPDDVTVELESDIPNRFGDTERMWTVESSKGRWGGWVDAYTGEVLDVIVEATSDELGSRQEELVFPVQKGGLGGMDALLRGRLVRRGDCLYVDGGRGPGVLVIWPPGYSYRLIDGSVHVFEAEGGEVLREGGEIEMGGGQIGDASMALPAQLREQIGNCEGQLWLAS